MPSYDRVPASERIKIRLHNNNICDYYVIESEYIQHIVILVPGTTDPINMFDNKPDKKANKSYTDPVNMFDKKSDKEANKSYWDKPFLNGMKSFVRSRKISVYSDEFSWTGDNEIDARKKAGKKLLEHVKTLTGQLRFEKLPIYLHFIGHSHGGNVINEYTQLAENDPAHKFIKVKSIVYLSTPFFTKQAQINTNVLHEKCEIINVYNDYDLTQRFVANFSMRQMPELISAFEGPTESKDPNKPEKPNEFDPNNTFNGTLEKLAAAPYADILIYLFKRQLVDSAESLADNVKSTTMQGLKYSSPILYYGIKMRSALEQATTPQQQSLPSISEREFLDDVLDIFKNISLLLTSIQNILKKLNKKYPKFITGDILATLSDGILDSLIINLSNPIKNIEKRVNDKNPDFSFGGLIDDIGPGIGDFIRNLNNFLQFNPKDPSHTSGLRSNFSDVIGEILLTQIETFDDTMHKPDAQFSTLEAKKNGDFNITHINVTTKDPYHTCMESKNHAAFLNKMEQLEDDYNKSNQQGDEGANIRAEIVFNLLAQEHYGVFKLLDMLLRVLGALTGGRTDSLVRTTRKNIARYSKKLQERDNKIIHHDLRAKRKMSGLDYLNTVIVAKEVYNRVLDDVDSYFTTPFSSAKGGIPYLAVESHSVSRRSLLPEVANIWGAVDIMPINKVGSKVRSYTISSACNGK